MAVDVLILHDPGNSDCDKTLKNISLAEVPDHDQDPESLICVDCGSFLTKLKVTTGCDTTVEMSQA